MEKKLMVVSEVQCTVLEVKVIEGLGTTIDVVLVNGVLHEGDQIVFCGMQGPIVTTIRALLTPHPMKELQVKNSASKGTTAKSSKRGSDSSFQSMTRIFLKKPISILRISRRKQPHERRRKTSISQIETT
ncbi:hypothetical protein MRB53_005995 [Persea americana]|uniref:Uncharacterized protein n=1 Tax=Persea americana TaxID=3435 RepID=A0ACC2MEQ0_PERAE|nr:hypothetical protein MRB53_005995 [Persea americana]